MNKKKLFHIASSLVLLAFLLSSHCSFAQVPKLFLKFIEKQSKIQSGYVSLQKIYTNDNDTITSDIEEAFFISTPRNFKYVTYRKNNFDSCFYCKSALTGVTLFTRKSVGYSKYWDDEFNDAKFDINFDFAHPIAGGFTVERFGWENCTFQRIAPKIHKKNIRYKIVYPDDDIDTGSSHEWEFDRKTLNWIQMEYSGIYCKTEQYYGRTDILEQRLYDYIHPDILDTISFKYEEIKKGYDQQCVIKQAEKDSLFQDSIMQLATKNGGMWVENIPEEVQEDTVYYMPEWKFPLLSGDSIYSDSINSQFLLIDMWYVSCYPCRMAMRELATIDTLYDESLLKIVSLNIYDKDTAKMRQVVNSLNLKCDIACNYGNDCREMLQKMSGGECQGYPQIYLIDMKTKEVIWYACGWYDGFTKDIGEMLGIGN